METQNTTNNAADDYYSLNFGAKVDTSIPADTYTSRVTLSVTASPVLATEYSLTYDGNGATGGTAPAKQIASSYDENYEFTVVGNTGGLTKTGYTFLGWADSASATSVQYTAGSKVTVSEGSPSRTVYAVWKADVFGGIVYMQEMTAAICSAAETGDTTQLVDKRDGKKYWVTRFSDDRCWMTQNLDYDDPDATRVASPNDWISSYTERVYWDPGLKVINGEGTLADEDTDTHLLVGNYYNWESATAGSGNQTEVGNEAPRSICPKGWALPTSGGNIDDPTSEAGILLKSEGFINENSASVLRFQESPYYFLRGGTIYGKQLTNKSWGNYWSSTKTVSNASNLLAFADSHFFLSNGYYSNTMAYNIRCISE